MSNEDSDLEILPKPQKKKRKIYDINEFKHCSNVVDNSKNNSSKICKPKKKKLKIERESRENTNIESNNEIIRVKKEEKTG